MGRIEIDDIIGDGDYEVDNPSFSFFLFYWPLIFRKTATPKEKEKVIALMIVMITLKDRETSKRGTHFMMQQTH